MDKVSNEKVAELLLDSAQAIRKYASENKALQDKIAAMELRERAEKLAADMHTKGVRLDTPREVLIDELEKEAGSGQLDVIQKAVEMVGPDMGKFAQINNDDQRNSSGSSDFERYLVGGVG